VQKYYVFSTQGGGGGCAPFTHGTLCVYATVTPKTTEQHLIARTRSDKSLAYVNNNKRLRSTFEAITLLPDTLHRATSLRQQSYLLPNTGLITVSARLLRFGVKVNADGACWPTRPTQPFVLSGSIDD